MLKAYGPGGKADMIKATGILIDRPKLGIGVDVLSDMLSLLRLSGGVFLCGELRSPWSISTELSPDDCVPFFPRPRHMIAYHFVRSGRMTCETRDSAPIAVSQGEIVLFPRNDPHVMHGPQKARPKAARDLVCPSAETGLLEIRIDGSGERTMIYCGFLGSMVADDSLLKALPPMMKVALDAGGDDWIGKSIAFASENLSMHSPEAVGKLAEGLFATAVLRYVESLPEGEGGWVAGLRDPMVGRALALIHARYAEPWTLDTLADEAGASKSVLAERFRTLIGEAPMQYCRHRRMHVAANLLRDGNQNAASVAYAVGFNSEAAFSRAFKREFGRPPAMWQREQATMH